MVTPVTKLFLLSFATLAVCHYLLLTFALYWRMPWFDLPMHLFGGAIVALGWFALGDSGFGSLKRFRTLRTTLLFVIVVAVTWEIYEYVLLFEYFTANYPLDTAIDMILGVLGGIVGYVLGARLTDSTI